MLAIITRRRSIGVVSVVLIILLILGLYKTTAYTGSRPQQIITDKLNLNRPDPVPDSPLPPVPPPPPPPPPASGGSSSTAEQPSISTSGHVLDEDLVLHTSHATYPRLTRLSDGSILLGFTHIEAPTHVLTIKRSTDNGRTFEPWGEVTRCDHNCGNLFLLEVPASETEPHPKVLAAFRNHDVVDPIKNRKSIYFRITVCESLDGGRTWKYLSQAAEKPAPWGLWEPFMRIGLAGEVQMTYSQELQARDQDTMMRTSYDRGRTWTDARTITGAEELLRDGMTGIASTTDRGQPALVMVFETTRHRTFSVEAVISYDDGSTWGHRQVVFEAQPGANAGSPQIEAFANGGLATVFMTDMDVEKRDWPRKASVKAVFGGPLVDGKIQWQQTAQPACPPSSFWPGVFRLNDTQLLAVCDHSKGVRGRILEWS